MRQVCALLFALGGLYPCLALDPRKALTQYSRTVWTQEQGLPQDTIRAITQTTDGYLWLGTDEGLARFDGYEFVTFSKDRGDLPSNSVTALAAGSDGSLWIGTAKGLTSYRNRHFRNYNRADGLPDDSVASLTVDHAGDVWAVAGGSVSRFDGTTFTNFLRGRDIPMTSVRTVTVDPHSNVYVAGYSAVARFESGKFVTVVGPSTLAADFPLGLRVDQTGNIWILGTRGVIERSAAGAIRRYGVSEGLPGSFGLTDAMGLDHDGALWVGTAGGVARLEGGRFRTRTQAEGGERGTVRCIFEDREGNLWLGTNNGLTRLHDDVFTVYGKDEGLLSDEPNTVHQDHAGRIWIGFLDGGLMMFSGGKPPAGMPKGGVFAIRETRAGELLVAGRDGLTRLSDGRFRTFAPPEPLGRKSVYDVLEDSTGNIWLAMTSGLGVLGKEGFQAVIPSGRPVGEPVVALTEGRDGSVWAGGPRGLWHVTGNQKRIYTTADGLGSDQVHSLYQDHAQDSDDTLWIGTFGGGLNALRNGKFLSYTAKDGLLSDNISHIVDDGESLWLSTTRGICRVSKRQLWDFAEHRIKALQPESYGVADGLRSAQESPNVSAGGDRHADGSLWFVTSHGLAVYEPHAARQAELPPSVHLTEMSTDRRQLEWGQSPQVPPGNGRLQIRYAAIHLSAPDRVQYSYKLSGLDSDWVRAGRRRGVTYDNLRKGHYLFTVRAELPGGEAGESSYEFDMLPHFYETAWFRLLGALMLVGIAWMVYRVHLGQIRSRFAAVLGERARLAREIHDTLAQAFFGISSQLDVVETRMPNDAAAARSSLDLARRMAQHSLTEARRSVMDLRAAALEDQDLAAALKSGTNLWAAGSGVDVDIDVSGEAASLPEDVSHHVLRIAQEAVTNVLKHAGAKRIALKLRIQPKKLNLTVVDNGCGFEPRDVFASLNGHFGLIGMRERAEQLGGELRLESGPGRGTQLEVTVPLP